ncbi:Hypothetical protein SMAX5B_006731 [Scophthalmus maximus]|uniref:Uncharacterized protein n=1 Tax=Scophthalmus maximus TaxID=52904 RepID=A0A2U9AVH2_SCOMX|nr:Hypothetical protein SMAX5B_006731 [Scophthalmus maximus]
MSSCECVNNGICQMNNVSVETQANRYWTRPCLWVGRLCLPASSIVVEKQQQHKITGLPHWSRGHGLSQAVSESELQLPSDIQDQVSQMLRIGATATNIIRALSQPEPGWVAAVGLSLHVFAHSYTCRITGVCETKPEDTGQNLDSGNVEGE